MGITTVVESVFQGLEAESLLLLRDAAVQRTYPPGTMLCRQGEMERIFYIIVEGRVIVTRLQPDGEEHILGYRGPNEYFGEMALLDDRPRMANVLTLTQTTVLEVTEQAFTGLLEQSPVVAYAIALQVLSNLRSMDQKAIEELTEKNEALRKAYDDLRRAQAALIEKERLERELEIAAEVQRSLLPGSLPRYPDYAFAAYLHPARYVGGDLYDVLPLDEEHVGILMADVVDKSIHAALFMAVVRTLFRTECRHSLSPADVIQAVHNGMMDASDAMFVTAFYGVLHLPSGRLTYVMGGQERPLLLRDNKRVLTLEGSGRFLGMIEMAAQPEYRLQLRPGDRLLLFSDGVPDAMNLEEEQYGYERLRQAMVEGCDLELQQLVNHIVTHVQTWSQGATAFDDLTLLAVERLEEDGSLSSSS